MRIIFTDKLSKMVVHYENLRDMIFELNTSFDINTHLSRSVLLIWLRSFSHFPEMQDLWIINFLSFFHEFSNHKVREVTDPNFCK